MSGGFCLFDSFGRGWWIQLVFVWLISLFCCGFFFVGFFSLLTAGSDSFISFLTLGNRKIFSHLALGLVKAFSRALIP